MRLALLVLNLLGATALASEAPAPEGCQPSTEAVLNAVNALRAQGQRCGARLWPAAPPLVWSASLGESAQRYAQELARRDRIDHVGEAASSLRARLRAVGYPMRTAGENLAGGPDNLDEALGQWLASPDHCENLMLSDFRELGLACVAGPGRFQRYWVMHLAAPLRSGGAAESSAALAFRPIH
jgi:uncharacterized protein YkwD